MIINDGSKDNTYELLQKCAATRPLLVSLINQTAVTVLQYFMDIVMPSGYESDIIFQTDSDGQTNLIEFEPFGTRGPV